jgi:hypothetical protein
VTGSGDEDDGAQRGEGVVELLGPCQRSGRCKVSLRAERVIRPGVRRCRRRRVSVAISVSPSPIRLVQRARLWAVTFKLSQAALAPNFPDGKWLSPTPYLRSRIASSTTAMVGFEFEGGAVAVGHERVIGEYDEQGEL